MLGPAVMLALSSRLPPAQMISQMDGWFMEIKFDGIRAVVNRAANGEVTITNRRRTDISYRYPEIVEAMNQERFAGVVDGEIVVAGPTGRPAFHLAHRRDAQSAPARIAHLARTLPATFMPFDVLEDAGLDVRSLPYTARRERLMSMFTMSPVPISSQDGATMWAFVQEHELEGLIAKRGDSAYRPGRQGAWIKLKSTRRVTVLIGGIVPGRGSRGPVGALQMFLRNTDTGVLDHVGNVGSGLSDQDMVRVTNELRKDQALVVEVEYLELSPGRQLRIPVFKAFRPEIDPDECTTALLA